MRRAAFILQAIPYAALLVCVLIPVGLAAYVLAATARAAVENWRSGWRDNG